MRSLTQEEKVRCDNFEEDIRKTIGELQSLSRKDYKLSVKNRILSYAKLGDKHALCLPVSPDSKLAPIERFVTRASKLSGFSEVALVLHLLSGVHRLLPRYRMNWRSSVA